MEEPVQAANQSNGRHSVAVLGATGSIGSATLDVVRSLGDPWQIAAVSAHSRSKELLQIAQDVAPSFCVSTCSESAAQVDWSQLPSGCKHLSGQDGLIEAAQSDRVDTVVAAVVGAAGLPSTLAAAEAGKRLALANKEALVVAGSLLTSALQQSGGEMLPVDSEHCAIFQAIQSGQPREVARVILTASGGPFRSCSADEIANATVDDALAHPTWEMGRKITIDSATMMNKALEIIEARWLFDLPAEKIEVVVHPQSIIHSMVEFVDGSIIAQLSPPDMRLPIQYALTFPSRQVCPAESMDFTKTWNLQLEPVDLDRFPALKLGWEVVRRGGTTGAVLSAANEAAVELFLNGQIKFPEITAGCKRILDEHDFSPSPRLDELMRLDAWAREEIQKWAAVC
ncbi:MAG: 1-deoxy-D-xylulose-5-phosphate reductoisomerase [Aureliella sp.]